jgi:hypothetical protein
MNFSPASHTRLGKRLRSNLRLARPQHRFPSWPHNYPPPFSPTCCVFTPTTIRGSATPTVICSITLLNSPRQSIANHGECLPKLASRGSHSYN